VIVNASLPGVGLHAGVAVALLPVAAGETILHVKTTAETETATATLTAAEAVIALAAQMIGD
jgi:UDP-3-O-acyl-N-acetylglucosamine deacetylase